MQIKHHNYLSFSFLSLKKLCLFRPTLKITYQLPTLPLLGSVAAKSFYFSAIFSLSPTFPSFSLPCYVYFLGCIWSELLSQCSLSFVSVYAELVSDLPLSFANILPHHISSNIYFCYSTLWMFHSWIFVGGYLWWLVAFKVLFAPFGRIPIGLALCILFLWST